ncbi:MAG: IPT/TIG domain-containing protein, partial [Myxococcota bacterium]
RAGSETPGELPPQQADPNAIILNAAQPNVGLLSGGTQVTLIGDGFQPGDTVSFGGVAVPADQVIWNNENNIAVVTPQFTEQGPVDITVSEPGTDRSSTLVGGFTFVGAPSIESLSPARGPVDGGGLVTLIGNGFIAGTEVYFGDVQAEVVQLTVGNIRAVIPPLPFDVFTVSIRNTVGSASVQDAFQTFEPLRLDEVRPIVGDLAGGSGVLVEGTGFVPGTDLTVGDSFYEEPEANRRETEIQIVAAAGSEEGAVDVRAENENGVDLLRDGYVYVDFTDPTPRIAAIVPPAAPIEGNSSVTLVGVGFEDPAVTVTFGETEGDCFAQSVNAIRCVTPTGEGLVDVEVVSGGTTITSEDAFNFVPLRIDAVVNSEGAIAGGTFVRIFGDGFDNESEVFFDGRPATDVISISSTELNAKTPPGFVGTVDVTVESFGLSRTRSGAFTYFDPDANLPWTSGGPINGAVNVTVIDTGTGDPVPDAFVVVGVNDSELSGRTNTDGQVVISA